MSEFDLDYELEFERELEAEELQQMPPEDLDPEEAASASRSQATQHTMPMLMRPDPLACLSRMVRGWEKVEVENQQNPDFMPPIGCMASDGRKAFTPKPKTQTSAGNVLACVAEMGRGKSTMTRNFNHHWPGRRSSSATLAQHLSTLLAVDSEHVMYAASAARNC